MSRTRSSSSRPRARRTTRAGRAPPALTPAKADSHGFGSYLAADYDELADSPVEMGAFWSAEFEACGVPHRFVVAGAPRLLRRRAADRRHARRSARRRCASGTATRSASAAAQAAARPLRLHAQRGRRRLRRAGAPPLHRADLHAARPAALRRREAGRGLHHAAGPDQPRVLPHLERQAPAAGRVRRATTTAARTTRSCCGSSRASPATTTTCCCAAPACIDDASYLRCSTRPSTRCCRRRAAHGAVGGAGQLRRLGQVLPAGRADGQRHRELLHQGRAGRAVLRPHAARRRPGHARRRDARCCGSAAAAAR